MPSWIPSRRILLPEGRALTVRASAYEGGVGAGIQGETDLGWLCRYADVVLVLEGEEGYARSLGSRAWFRLLNDGTNWRDAEGWARRCAERFKPLYDAGVRVLIPLNEPNLAAEGGGDSEADYIFLGQWGVAFMTAFRREAAARGMPDVVVVLPNLSPGHKETELGGIETLYQGYFKHMVPFLQMVDIIGAHYYWEKTWGFLDQDGAMWKSRRIEYDQEYLRLLGVNKPWAVTEFNRDGGALGDVAGYMSQVQRYYEYLSGRTVAQFYFIATTTSTDFLAFALDRMPGAMDMLAAWHPGTCQGNQPPQCSPGYHWDGSQCVPDAPCQPPGGGCPSGSHWEQGRCECVGDTPPPGAEWSARYVGQSGYRTLRQGEVSRAWLQAQNTGTRTWYLSQFPRVRLATAAPRNRNSVFAGGAGWSTPNRIVLPVAAVQPQEGVTIEFDWTVPRDLVPGTYREWFELYSEDGTWIPGMGAYWDITVVPGIGPPAGTLPVVMLGLLGVAAVGAAVAFGSRGKKEVAPPGFEYVEVEG